MIGVEPGQDDYDGEDDFGSEPPEETSPRDELMEYLVRGRADEVARVLRQLDELDGEFLKTLAFLFDGDPGDHPWRKGSYPFRLKFVRRDSHRPRRRTIDFFKGEVVKAVAAKLKKGVRPKKKAFRDVAVELKERGARAHSFSYVRDAWYASQKKSKTVLSPSE